MGARASFAITRLTAFLAVGAPLALTLSAIAPTEAAAQDALFAEPSLEMLPTGDIVGDGTSSVALHVVAMGTDGAPLSGLSGRVNTASGQALKLNEVRPGLYRIDWTPPKTSSVRNVEINIKGKTADKTLVSKRWSIPIVPPMGQQVSVNSSPERIVLGQDASATLTFTLSGGAAQALSDGDLVVTSSSGTVANLTPLGDGRFTALYNPPSKLFPHLALITVADRRDPSATYGVLPLSLVGKANFPVVGTPNSRVIVKIGDSEFGPIQADASGRAQVPIIVPPGSPEAKVISVLGEKRTEEPLDLKVPPTQRVRLLPSHETLPADPNAAVELRAYVAQPGGGADEGARVNFTATAGSVTAARHEGSGIYVATYSPPFGNSGSQATIQVSVEDTKSTQSDAITVNLLPARPGTLTLTPEPATLSSDAAGFKVFAKVTGSDGVGMPSRNVTFQAAGAKQQGSLGQLGSGDYEAQFTTTGTGPVEVVATVRSDASGNPLRKVLVLPSRDRLPNDGLSSTMLTILTLDGYGYPVANTPVTLKRVAGDGSVPATATTDKYGVAQVFYTAGRGAGLAHIQASVGAITGAAGVLQLPDGAGPTGDLPASGSAAKVNLEDGWSNIVTTSRIEREGMVGAAVTAVSTASAAGPISRMTMVAEPASVAPGGTVTLKINTTDAEGRGVAGQQLNMIASAGTLGAIQDMGGGQYQTTLSVPVGVAGEVKLSAGAPDGSVAAFASVPIAGASGWGTGVASTQTAATQTTPEEVAATTPEEKPKKEKKVKEPKQPREASDRPWLRASAGYLGGQYSYEQTPLSSTGPLYPQRIVFGGSVTSPAGASGFNVDGRAWMPGLDFVGVDAGFATTRYTVTLPGYNQSIPDWINIFHVTGLARVPFEAGANDLHVAARVGWSMDDYIVYRQGGNAAQTTLNWEQLTVQAIDVGAEFGAEVGDNLFGNLGGGIGLGNGSELYRWGFDANVGYVIYSDLFIDAEFGYTSRSSGVYNAVDGAKSKVGELSDQNMSFGGGVGWQF